MEIAKFKNQPLTMSFYNETHETLGELKEVDGKLKFEGDVAKSAKVLFDELIVLNCKKIKELEVEITSLKQQLQSTESLK